MPFRFSARRVDVSRVAFTHRVTFSTGALGRQLAAVNTTDVLGYRGGGTTLIESGDIDGLLTERTAGGLT